MDKKDINRIVAPEIIAKILTKHFKSRGKLSISTLSGDRKGETRIVDNDPHAGYILLDALPEPAATTIENADTVEIRGSITSLYSWFRTSELNVIVEDGERYYEIPYPEEFFQLQRRNAFRIQIDPRFNATLSGVIEQPASEIAHHFQAAIQNISTTGAKIVVTGETASLIGNGKTIAQCQILIPRILDLSVDTTVRNRRTGPTDDELIVGVSFGDLPSRSVQSIASAVMELQRLTLAEQVND